MPGAIPPAEAADRLAIRGLVEAYAQCADRRDPAGLMALFIADAHFIVYRDATDPMPTQVLTSRAALAPQFEALNQYRATTHFVGQSMITALMSDRAAAVTYGLAHHLAAAGDAPAMTVAAQRNYDTFAKAGGAWRFAERWLHIDWIETDALA